jgi:DNA-directed RNA polymerase subunit RPC12/RpoP
VGGARHTFAPSVRTVECPNCSAPLESPLQGGQFTCKYCSAVAVVVKRRVHQPGAAGGAAKPPSPTEDVARLSRLQAQVDHPVHGHAYDLERVPAGLEGALAGTAQALALLQGEWIRLKSSTSVPPGTDGQLRICWVAVALAATYRRHGDPLRTRAVLETALDELEDEGHRHIVRCRLAREAAEAGDTTAARAWLGECDPAPEVLELDGEYRLATARVCIAEGDGAGALRQLGAQDKTIPVDPPHRLAFAELRVAAHEKCGAHQAAWAELQAADFRFGAGKLRQRLAASGLAPQTLGSLEREEQDKRQRARQQAAQVKRAARRTGCVMLLILLLIVAGVVAFVVLYDRFRPFPISCGRDGEVVLEDRVEDLPRDVLIEAPAGCKITIRNCKLKGRKVIEAGYGTKVVVVQSTLEGREGVVHLGYDSELRIGKKSKIISRGSTDDAIDVGWNTKVNIKNTIIESAGQAFDIGRDSEVSIAGGKILIKGGTPEWAYKAQYGTTTRLTGTLLQTEGGALQLGYRSKLFLERSTVVSGSEGDWLLDAGYQSEVRSTWSKLTSGSGGLKLEWKCKARLTQDSSLRAKGSGIRGRHQLEALLDKSKLEAGEDGVDCDFDSRVKLVNKSEIRAGHNGITARYKLRVTVDDSSIYAGDAAVSGEWESTVTGKNAHVEGKSHSLKLGRDPAIDLRSSEVVGPKTISKW